MEPSLFFVLFWRLAVDVLYPYSYMDRSLEDALANEHLLWTPNSRFIRQLMSVARDAFQTILMMVMMMEMFQGLDAALDLNIPAAVNRPRPRRL
ncbi:uncharacterized protein [Drosophila kikkawai]|uniref:Uncharacterized protein n=1 Tax=Drosophila kikkawai TaxID=30033 RepID=A0A6P4I966_DROKI|nr:uncharacterized protein LOC108073366 [Drosophila kikkawai]